MSLHRTAELFLFPGKARPKTRQNNHEPPQGLDGTHDPQTLRTAIFSTLHKFPTSGANVPPTHFLNPPFLLLLNFNFFK